MKNRGLKSSRGEGKAKSLALKALALSRSDEGREATDYSDDLNMGYGGWANLFVMSD